MPHSPRWHRDRLWLLESGEGSLAEVDVAGRSWRRVAALPGFTRGLDFVGPLAFIGLSQVRESAVFSGIPLGRHVRALVEFIRLLPPLPPPARGEREARGERAFRDAGCAGCHVESFETAPSDVAALDRQAVRAYSDFLLHDMGPALADGIVVGDAGGTEFRTAPLWGAAKSAPYLHDGRAATLREAVVLHDGEAARARDRFLALAEPDREALLAFLGAL